MKKMIWYFFLFLTPNLARFNAAHIFHEMQTRYISYKPLAKYLEWHAISQHLKLIEKNILIIQVELICAASKFSKQIPKYETDLKLLTSKTPKLCNYKYFQTIIFYCLRGYFPLKEIFGRHNNSMVFLELLSWVFALRKKLVFCFEQPPRSFYTICFLSCRPRLHALADAVCFMKLKVQWKFISSFKSTKLFLISFQIKTFA